MSDAAEHSAVKDGFECECGVTRKTPLGMSRHRSMCRCEEGDDE